MNNHPAILLLEKAVDEVTKNINKYVKRPGKDFTRDRKLSLKILIDVILTMTGGSLNKEMFQLHNDKGIDVTKSAFVQQRDKLKPEIFLDILRVFNKYIGYDKTYKGYRVLAVDGSDFNIAKNVGTEAAVTKRNGDYLFSQLHLNALYDVLNRCYVDAIIQPKTKTDEDEALWKFEERDAYGSGVIYIADRGYEGYNTLAHFAESKNADLVLRVKSGSGCMRIIRNLPNENCDTDVECELTTTRTKEDKEKHRIFIRPRDKGEKRYGPGCKVTRFDFPTPYRLMVRVIRFVLPSGEIETLVTTLPREWFSTEDIIELYRMRWGIETSFCQLKYTIGAINFHSKSITGSMLELLASLVTYTVVEYALGCIIVKKMTGNKYSYKVNRAVAVKIIIAFWRTERFSIDPLYQQLYRYIEPIRPGRCDERKAISPKKFICFSFRVAA